MSKFIRSFLSKLFIGLAISIIGIQCIPSQTFAAGNFRTTLHTTYTVTDNGTTTVEHQVTFENQTPTVYIKQYGLSINSPQISNVLVTSQEGKLTPEITKTATQTSLDLTFKDQIVGEGKKRDLFISYQNPDARLISGQVLEIAVPQLANYQEYDAYTLNIITPKQYGKPTRLNAPHQTTERNGQLITLIETKGDQSISAIFGQRQLFNASLKYTLENTTSQTGIAQIALPPDTAYQEVIYTSLDPLPETIKTDADGNWIATYKIPSNTPLTVQAQAQFKIFLDHTNPLASTNQPPASSHLSAQNFWETQDSFIKQKAEELQTPSNIFAFVTNHLKYDYTRLDNDTERFGAVKALAQPEQAACQEFTDAFIAIARAAGIPARRMTGYAYTQNSTLRPLSLVEDVLHAWPEYYDVGRNRWVPVDPTWQQTTGGLDYFNTFDLNHVVFAINGTSSTTPYPVGSYKLENSQGKDLDITFSQEEMAVEPHFEVALEPSRVLGIVIPGRYTLKIANTTGKAWYGLVWQLTTPASQVSLSPSHSLTESNLLPFQTLSVPIMVSSQEWISAHQATVQVAVGYQDQGHVIYLPTQELNVYAQSRLLSTLFHPYTGVGLVISSILTTLITGSILVLRRRR